MLAQVLKDKNISLYRLSKNSGLPYATLHDVLNGKTSLNQCTAQTVYKLARALNISMEELLAPYQQERISFEAFKSNVGHRLRAIGDLAFIEEVLLADDIPRYYQMHWLAESLYLLAMLDYLSRVHGLPLWVGYQQYRQLSLQAPLYPAGVVALAKAGGGDLVKAEARAHAIPEFLRHNIIENEVRRVV